MPDKERPGLVEAVLGAGALIAGAIGGIAAARHNRAASTLGGGTPQPRSGAAEQPSSPPPAAHENAGTAAAAAEKVGPWSEAEEEGGTGPLPTAPCTTRPMVDAGAQAAGGTPEPLRTGWSRPRALKVPRPTYWPAALAFGISLLALGALTTFVVAGAGFIILVLSISGWIHEVLREQH